MKGLDEYAEEGRYIGINAGISGEVSGVGPRTRLDMSL